MVWLFVVAGLVVGLAVSESSAGGSGALLGSLLGGLLGVLLRVEVNRDVERVVERRLKLLQGPPGGSARVPRPAEATVSVAMPAPALVAVTGQPSHSDPSTVPVAPVYSKLARDKNHIPEEAFDRWATQVRDWLIGGNTVLRLGLVTLFVGLAFLAKFAIEHALLPPQVRLAGIGLAGLVLFGIGWRQRHNAAHRVFSLSMQGGGVGVLYLTVYATFHLYHLLSPGATFALLALVCVGSTTMALLQNAQTMAFVGFAGAFVAPVLASTNQGDHVGLFCYYLLLNGGIVATAAKRAWRPLNLLGFFATFGIATAWGVLRYRPEHLASTLPFLVAFFAQYLLAAWWYALRHGLPKQRAVDATMVFGNPIISMGLLAQMVWDIPYASAAGALGLAVWYALVGFWTRQRHPSPTGRWLVECCVALAMGFATLAVPLALDGRWTSAAWAAEGAAVFWIGLRQQRWLARLAGSALQGLAAASYMHHVGTQLSTGPHLANPTFVGATLLAASALGIAWLVHQYSGRTTPTTRWGQGYLELERRWPEVMGAVGFLWWQWALWCEIERLPAGEPSDWWSAPAHHYLAVLAWVLSAWLAHHLAKPGRQKPYTGAIYPALVNTPFLLWATLQAMDATGHALHGGGWWIWPLVLAAHLHTLRHVDQQGPRTAWSWVHSTGAWLLMLLGGNLLYVGLRLAGLWHTTWALVTMLGAGGVVLLTMGIRSLFDTQAPVRQRWPLQHDAYAYLLRGALPLTVLVLLGTVVVAASSSGDTEPLPYWPLFNPTDVSLALALAATALWGVRVRASDLTLATVFQQRGAEAAWGGVAFVAINSVWLRSAHHFGGVPWNTKTLFDSFLVQAGYSLLWTLLALVLMITAHRRQARTLWMGGAALLGLTILKLLLVDLSNRGGGERIVTFIGVGVLMLVIGYVAPMPPAQAMARKTAA